MAEKGWISRRLALKAAALFAGLGPLARAAKPTYPLILDNLTLWWKKPAMAWTEAMPLGNGRLGAMVFGGVPEERLQLNEDTVWAGSPYQPAHSVDPAALANIRALVFAGRYKEAQDAIGTAMMGTPPRQMSYQTIGSLVLTEDDSTPATQYQRGLVLSDAATMVTFTRNGLGFRRDTFVSPVDQVVVMRLTAEKPGLISFRARYDTPQKAAARGEGADLVLTGMGSSQQGIAGKVAFECRARFLAQGGTVTADADGIAVKGADSVVVLIAAASNFVNYDDLSADPAARVAAVLDKAAQRRFEIMEAEHQTEHRRLFDRVELDLGDSGASKLPIDERIAQGGDDPGLAMLYYQFGRYLMISSSRPGSQPANLQGIWNDALNAPWGGKYTININTEMNYWPAEPGNLAECVEPLIALVKDIAATGAVTAKEMYGARGWVCHHNTDLWRATAPIDAPFYGMWPMGGAWLCLHLWDHYDYGQDKAYLAAIYPVLKGACLFFLDTLQKDPSSGWMVTCPSMSPEHSHHAGVSSCAGPTMDMQILRDLFDRTARAAGLLAADDEFAAEILAMRQRLAPMKIGKAGQLQEWQEDWDMEAPDIHHRHVSHLFGLFPSHQINRHDTPELAAAAQRSLEIRGDESTGWATAWRINLWARLGEGDHAHKILKFLLGPERTYPDMFDAHPPFQIDGNFGGANAIMEMLIQSWDDIVMPLPALPSAWPDGHVRGLRLRGGMTADLVWRGGKLARLTLTSLTDKTVMLRYGGRDSPVPLRVLISHNISYT